MWLYTSNAVQPHRNVASKNGDLRYHGPKYKVLDVTSGIALALPLIAPPSVTEDARAGDVRAKRRCGVNPVRHRTEYSFNPIKRASELEAGKQQQSAYSR